jgi:hypothetical protein
VATIADTCDDRGHNTNTTEVCDNPVSYKSALASASHLPISLTPAPPARPPHPRRLAHLVRLTVQSIEGGAVGAAGAAEFGCGMKLHKPQDNREMM